MIINGKLIESFMKGFTVCLEKVPDRVQQDTLYGENYEQEMDFFSELSQFVPDSLKHLLSSPQLSDNAKSDLAPGMSPKFIFIVALLK